MWFVCDFGCSLSLGVRVCFVFAGGGVVLDGLCLGGLVGYSLLVCW